MDLRWLPTDAIAFLLTSYYSCDRQPGLSSQVRKVFLSQTALDTLIDSLEHSLLERHASELVAGSPDAQASDRSTTTLT